MLVPDFFFICYQAPTLNGMYKVKYAEAVSYTHPLSVSACLTAVSHMFMRPLEV